MASEDQHLRIILCIYPINEIVTYFGPSLCYRLSHRGSTSSSRPVDSMYVTGHAYVAVSLSGAKGDRSASRDGHQDSVKYVYVKPLSGVSVNELRPRQAVV